MTRALLRLRRCWLVTVVVAVLVLLGAPPASAHAELVRSDPPVGGMVSVGRSDLTLWFTEAVEAGASTFDLHTLDGAEVDTTVSISGAGDSGVARITATPLPKDTYVLDWRTLSLDDGHASRGSVVFGVGVRPVVVPSSGVALPETREVLLRWADLLAIMLAIGALAVSGRVLGSLGAPGRAVRRRARLVAALAATGAVVTGAIIPFLSTQGSGDSVNAWASTTWDTLTGTPWGHLWLARELALVIAVGFFWAWARRGTYTVGRVVAVLALGAAVWLEAWAGHAASLPNRSGLAAFVSACHLGAAGVWAGGLSVLAICLVPAMRRSPGDRIEIVGSVWRAFSPIAAIATVVVVATGLYEAGLHVPSVHSVTSTVYGGAVGAKVALVALALAMAALNTLLVHPRRSESLARFLGRAPGWAPVPVRRFPVLVTIEALVLIGAVAAAALLTSVPTAREIDSAAKPTAFRSAEVEGLFVTFEEVPGGPDRSRLIVRVNPTVRPAPAPVTGVDVTLSGPRGRTATVPLEPFELGRFEGEAAKLTPGRWDVAIAAHREGLADVVAPISWPVAPAQSDDIRPLQVVTTGVALLLLAGLVLAIVIARRRRYPVVDRVPSVREKVAAGR